MTDTPHPVSARPDTSARTALRRRLHDRLTQPLTRCLAVPGWVDRVLDRLADTGDAAPTAQRLVTAARAALPLSDAELDLALAGHPPIGERATGPGAGFSDREQAAITADADDQAAVAARLAAGNRAYERRYGHVFLIRAAGRSQREILAELERRLQLDPAGERAETERQLEEITLLRVASLAEAGSPAAPAPDAPAPGAPTPVTPAPEAPGVGDGAPRAGDGSR
jgi:2-oxo-4-hydroxy-4-carboxy-5-ureidoimidazoline decarboxylase